MKKYDRNYEMQLYKTEVEQLNVVRGRPLKIKYIKNPSKNVEIAAVCKNTEAYKYTKKIC